MDKKLKKIPKTKSYTKGKFYDSYVFAKFIEYQIKKYTFPNKKDQVIIDGKTDEYSYKFYTTDYTKNIYANITCIKNDKIKNLILGKKVKSISIRGGDLEFIPKLPDTIEYIEISLRETPKFIHKLPKNLKMLILKQTNIEYKLPDLSYLKKLWYLNASHNHIEQVRSGTLPNSLMYLNLNNNYLTKLPNDLPKNLIGLNCDNNELEYLDDLSYLKRLNYINAYKNKITKLPSNIPLNGVSINIGGNPLKTTF